MRLDLYLCEKGLAKSRSFAKTLIEEGYVTVEGKHVRKPSFEVSDDADVKLTGKPYEYVSRGGVKLEAAIKAFSADVSGKVCADIGASTGGFTDCLLRYGAEKVFAVDSGTGQLVPELSENEKVVNIENFNARELSAEKLGTLCDVAVCDVSFISQTLIHPAVRKILKPGGIFISLIKPQFESGKEGIGKGGIVRNNDTRLNAVRRVILSAEKNGLGCEGVIVSPITGGDGNTEYLMICVCGKEKTVNDKTVTDTVINRK